MIADEVPSDADIESIFSEQGGVDNNTTFILQDTDSASCSEFSESDSSEYETIHDSLKAD